MHYTRVYYWVFSWWANRIAYIPLTVLHTSLSSVRCTAVVCMIVMTPPYEEGAAVGFMTSHLLLSLYYRSLLPQMRNGSAKVCEVYCGDG